MRELTKLHEECVRGLSGEVAAALAAREEVRGECVIVIAAPTADELAEAAARAASVPATLEEAIAEGLASGEPKSALAKRLAKQFGVSKSEVYNALVES